MGRRKRELVIKDAAQLRALRTPVRQEIVRSFMKLGACTVGELAEDLGREAAKLYYHVHALVKARLVVKTGQREGDGRPEKTYALVAERILIDRSNASPSFLSALTDLNRATLRTAERELAASVASRSKGADDASMLLRLGARLKPRDAARAAEMLREAAEFMTERDDPEGGRPYSLTAAMVPLEK